MTDNDVPKTGEMPRNRRGEHPEAGREEQTQALSENDVRNIERSMQERGTVEQNIQDYETRGVSNANLPGHRAEGETEGMTRDSDTQALGQPVGESVSDGKIPARIGKYTIEKLLGKGGFGKVYLARDPVIERRVAIKVFAESDFNRGDTGKQRFFREAKAIGQLDHPHIIAIHDASESEGVPYLVMEYLEGHDLSQLMEQGTLPPTLQLLTMMITICQVLDYAHRKGIVHRDLKPANIFYTTSGTVKLMDFGIAKMDDTRLTQTGMIIGTVYYMSPEQLSGQPLDGRADIYSLGVLLYELFSHRLPFAGETITQVIHNMLMSEPLPFQPIDQRLNPALNAVIARAMHRHVDERYQSAAEVAHDLEHIRSSLDPTTATSAVGHDARQSMAAMSGKDTKIALPEGTRPVEPPILNGSHGPTTGQGSLETGNGNGVVDEAGGQPPVRRHSHRGRLLLVVLGILSIVAIIVLSTRGWRMTTPGKQVTLPSRPGRQSTIPGAAPTGVPATGQDQDVSDQNSDEQTRRQRIVDEWAAARSVNSIEACEGFIERYTNDPLAATELAHARSKKEQLQAEEKVIKDQEVKRAALIEDWRSVQQEMSRRPFETFIETWSREPLAEDIVRQAKEKLEQILSREESELGKRLASGPVMVDIAGGTFTMGDTFGDGDRDETTRQVSLKAYFIGRYEVTFMEYDRFCEDTNRPKPKDHGSRRKLLPVVGVNWFDAVQFCNWLSNRHELKPAYSISRSLNGKPLRGIDGESTWTVLCDFTANGFRLPTEAEWEYAARDRGKLVKYGHGDNSISRDQAVFARNVPRGGRGRGPEPVGTLPPNSLTLHDMSGNVWEWCWDWYAPYPETDQSDPQGSSHGTERVIRGGSWKNISAAFVRVSNRLSLSPSTRDHDVGFRLVRSK